MDLQTGLTGFLGGSGALFLALAGYITQRIILHKNGASASDIRISLSQVDHDALLTLIHHSQQLLDGQKDVIHELQSTSKSLATLTGQLQERER